MAHPTAKTTQPAPQPAAGASAHHERVLIIDFGSQVTQLIARRVRESGVYCEIQPFNRPTRRSLKRFDAEGDHPVGRAGSVTDDREPARAATMCSSWACRCWASATASRPWRAQLGGTVEAGHHREFGRAELEVKKPSRAVRRRVGAARAIRSG